MAARRLLIVMLVLLGISTLAAALVPQRTPNDETTTGSTSTQQQTTTAQTGSPPGFLPPTKILVGRKVKVDGAKKLQVPVVSPVLVGQQLSLHVHSRIPSQLSIPAFGQVGFASPNAPAIFDLVAETPTRIGVLFEPSGKVAAQVLVVTPKQAKKLERSKRRARAGSGRA
jgi:hypothetical protein